MTRRGAAWGACAWCGREADYFHRLLAGGEHLRCRLERRRVEAFEARNGGEEVSERALADAFGKSRRWARWMLERLKLKMAQALDTEE